jgi:demethylmenaquinone methyltransferase/2-methoxy-6-polyprenyl-1,4-benzoquinol methylase
VIGLDLDQKMIHYSSTKYPHISFVPADAVHIPLKNRHFKGIVLSYSLHDKSPEMRSKILEESKRLLEAEGKMLLVDFENPWNKRSKLGSFFVYLIERIAGKEHFRNGRQFLKQGGLRSFLKQNGMIEVERHNVELASSGIVLAKFD